MPSSIEVTALVVALIALIIALLQVVQQYLSSAVARGRVNRAAIGDWSAKNHYGWSWREWKLRVTYARPVVTVTHAVNRLDARGDQIQSKMKMFSPEYTWTWSLPDAEGARGLTRSRVQVTVYRLGDERQIPVPRSALTRKQRQVIEDVEKKMTNEYIPPCKGTWCNMMADLGVRASDVQSDDNLDADTIPTALDAPTMSISMSDLICFGFLLDMKITNFNLEDRKLDMVGNLDCSISTQHQQGVGMLARYSGLGARKTVQPMALDCTSPELATLIRTARGQLTFADCCGAVSFWGYNSIEQVFTYALSIIQGEQWQTADVTPAMDIEGDTGLRWNGKWAQPKVPVLPFLLSMCANISVANAFPHRVLEAWTKEQRQWSSQKAFSHITSSVGFIESPPTLFRDMLTQPFNLINMHDFKATYSYGHENGGQRGWLMTNFAEFCFRMSHVWEVPSMTDKVPILPQIKRALAEGQLDANWGAQYNSTLNGNMDQGRGWKMRANSLLWLQVMFFDTWIARRIEMVMGNPLDADVSIPVDIDSATRCTQIEQNKIERVGWRRSRLEFSRRYLRALADGTDGKAISFMTTGDKLETASCWRHIPIGDEKDWAAVDAVLTLRAVVLAARLDLMKDSSSLLDLQVLDPMIQLA